MTLRDQLHRYAEDREIDYVSAKNLGEMNGMKFENQQELIDWKKTIDSYLQTFKEDSLEKVEEACSKNKKKNKSKANDKTMPVAEEKESKNYTSYAKDEMGEEKPKSKTKKKGSKIQKESKQSFGKILREYEEGKKVTIQSKDSLIKMIDNADTQSVPQTLKVRMKRLIDKNKVEDALKLAIKNLTSGRLSTSKMTKDVKNVAESKTLDDMFK